MTNVSDMAIPRRVLVLNGGSSSIKVALFSTELTPRCLLRTTRDHLREPAAKDDAVSELFEWISHEVDWRSLHAVGHRIVFGGDRYAEPCRLTSSVLGHLRALSPYDPEHLPLELKLVERVAERRGNLPQVACFDSAFHRTLPTVAKLLPLPRHLHSRGVRRYGFHGLSYQFVVREIERTAGPAAARGRLVLAHLGGGASLAAVHGGKSVDTTMGFSPSSGIPMSTRSGDVDPGVM